VAAHEVAHLKHLDHSQRFWRLVLTHCPSAARAKKWLKAHGHDVHKVVA
jgi:predicted metal-dependent hydrolase